MLFIADVLCTGTVFSAVSFYVGPILYIVLSSCVRRSIWWSSNLESNDVANYKTETPPLPPPTTTATTATWQQEQQSCNRSNNNNNDTGFSTTVKQVVSYSDLCTCAYGMQVLQYLRYCHTSWSLTPLPCRVVNHCLVVQVLDRTKG